MSYDVSGVRGARPLEGSQARALFGQVMGLVALTCGFAALGAWVGRDFDGAKWILPWIGAIACLIALQFVNRRSPSLATLLLFAVGFLLGVSIGTTVTYYLDTQPNVVWQAAGATGLTVAGMGAWGYATRRDLSYMYRILFFALIGLIVFGLVMVLFRIEGAQTIYALAGIAIFAGYTLVDFNRLRRAGRSEAVPLAAGIFLDVFNLFLLFLQLFGNNR
jgi:FtsH-binding integral membrane protein